MCVSLYLGVTVGFDADVQTRPVRSCGRRVGPQVDNDGPCGIEPLERPLRAAEVDLLHISPVRLVAQAAAGRSQKQLLALKKCRNSVRFRRTYGKYLRIVWLSRRPALCSCLPTNLSPWTDVVALSLMCMCSVNTRNCFGSLTHYQLKAGKLYNM